MNAFPLSRFHTRNVLPLLASVVCCCLQLPPLAAPAATAEAIPKPALEISTRVERPPETGELLCCDARTPQHHHTFILPATWRIEPDAARQRLVLRAPDYSANIEIRFAASSPALVPQMKPEALRKQALDRFVGAVLVEESACYSSQVEGRAFDVEWSPIAAIRNESRLAFLPAGDGIELCLTTARERFKDFLGEFGALLTSFDIRHRSDDGRPSAASPALVQGR
ncbi:MAG: hypothetical protein HZA90_13865 [Verrucomicrobia bacterium]|nr:hypothetical protein [Verrucomicrobiota bacterium]